MGLLGFAVAQLGLKEQLVVGVCVALLTGLLVVRERPLFVLLSLVASFQFLVMKALGPLSLDTAGGAPGLYITSADVLLLVLYGLWLAEGTLVADVRRALGQPVFFIPLLAMVAVLPSLLAAENVYLAVAELARMLALYGLYLYVGLRVRHRRQLGYVLGAFALVAFVQCGIVLLQWKTGQSLGFEILGQQEAFAARLTETGEVLRPSGSFTHPVFLGAVLGPVALLATSLAIGLRRAWIKLAAVAAVGAAVVPMVVAQARFPLMSLAVGFVALAVVLLRSGRLRLGTLVAGAGLLAAVGVGALMMEPTQEYLSSDLRGTEIDVRMELNRVALTVIRDFPVAGAGLNNYELVMDRYAPNGVMFPGFPVHNLYLLVFAETGVIGLAGLMAVFLMLLGVSSRLAAVRNPVLGAAGAGLAATWVFFAVEELSSFSLRHAAPSLAFWLLAGLTIAGWRLAQQEESREVSEVAA
jgi:O-antigen ligase